MNNNNNLFVGVVEDINDPLNMNRVRVRVYRYHTPDKNVLPVSALPWAIVVNSVQSASISGVGANHGLVNGSWIIGFWVDDADQQPFVIGSFAANSTLDTGDTGFKDPDDVFPLFAGNDLPKEVYDHESSKSFNIKKLLKQEDIPVAVPAKVNTVSVEKDQSYYEQKPWSTPSVESTNKPSYPDNRVIRTKSGHVVEFDDTPGKERICLFHRSGSYNEIDASGNELSMRVGSKYDVVFGNNNVYVKGSMNLTVEGDLRTLVKGSYYLEVEGDKEENIKGSSRRKVELNAQSEIGQEFATNIGEKEYRLVGDSFLHTVNGDYNLKIAENLSKVVLGDSSIQYMGEKNEVVSENSTNAYLKNMTVAINNESKIESNGNMILKGSTLNLN